MSNVQIIEKQTNNFLILEKKLEDEYKSINNDNSIFIIKKNKTKISFTDVVKSTKKSFYKDDIRTVDALSIVLQNFKNSEILERYSTLSKPLCHLVLFKYNNVLLYFYYEIPELYLKKIELFDNISKNITPFLFEKTNSIKPYETYRYESINFFVKNNNLESITVDNNLYNISIITNRFYQHLSSVIIGKITIGEPIYIKSFLLNDYQMIDVFQERRYNIIDATQKFIICKRTFELKEEIYNFSTIVDNSINTINQKNLTERDLSSLTITRNQVEAIFKSTKSWPIYDIYLEYIKYLDGENDSFSNLSYDDLRQLFKSKDTITFYKKINRRRKRIIKRKANIFYNAIISNNFSFNFYILELMTQGTQYSHVPQYILQGYLQKTNVKNIDEDLQKFSNDTLDILSHSMNNINYSKISIFMNYLQGNTNQDSKGLTIAQKQAAVANGKEYVKLNKEKRAQNFIEILEKIFKTNSKETKLMVRSNINDNIEIDPNKIRIELAADMCIKNSDNFKIAFAYLSFKRGMSNNNILQNFLTSLEDLFRNPRVGKNISTSILKSSIQNNFLIKTGIKKYLETSSLFSSNIKVNIDIVKNLKNIYNNFMITGCKTINCNNNGQNLSQTENDRAPTNETVSPDTPPPPPNTDTSSSSSSSPTPPPNTPPQPPENNYGIVSPIQDLYGEPITYDGEVSVSVPDASEIIVDDVDIIIEAEPTGVTGDDLIRKRINIELHDTNTILKLYLSEWGTNSSIYLYRSPPPFIRQTFAVNLNEDMDRPMEPVDYTNKIVLSNNILDGVIPDINVMRAYNNKYANVSVTWSNDYPRAIYETYNVIDLQFNRGILANELKESIMSRRINRDIQNIRDFDEIMGISTTDTINGERIIKNIPPEFVDFLNSQNVESKFISFYDFFYYFRKLRVINFFDERYVIEREFDESVTNNVYRTSTGRRYTYYSVQGNTQYDIDRYDKSVIERLNANIWTEDITYSVRVICTELELIKTALPEQQSVVYWTEKMQYPSSLNEEKINEVMEYLNKDSIFPRVVRVNECIQISPNLYYYVTNDNITFLAEEPIQSKLVDFTPDKLTNIVNTVERYNEYFTREGKMDEKLQFYDYISSQYNISDEGLTITDILLENDTHSYQNRLQRVENFLKIQNISNIEKYVLELNGLYDRQNNKIDVGMLLDLNDDKLDELSTNLFGAGFILENETYDDLRIQVFDDSIIGREQIYRFIQPAERFLEMTDFSQAVLNNSTSWNNPTTAETLFERYDSELLDEFINGDESLKNIFMKIENIRTVNDTRLSPRPLFIDIQKETFVGEFANDILNYVEYEELEDEFQITEEGNLKNTNNEKIYIFDVENDNIGKLLNSKLTETHITTDNIIFASYGAEGKQSVFNFNFKTGTANIVHQTNDNEVRKLNIQYNINNIVDVYPNITTTDKNFIIEIKLDNQRALPSASKISYIFPINENTYGKPSIEIVIDNTDDMGNVIKERRSFISNEQIQYTKESLQYEYTNLISQLSFSKSENLIPNERGIIQSSYLSLSDNIDYVKIDTNFFEKYQFSDIDKQNIIDLVNSKFDYYDLDVLLLSDVEDIELFNSNQENYSLKEQMYVNELELRTLNLKILDEMYRAYNNADLGVKSYFKYNSNNAIDLFLIGNMEEDELRNRYINSYLLTKDLYLNYSEILGITQRQEYKLSYGSIQSKLENFNNIIVNESMEYLSKVDNNLLNESLFDRLFAQQVYNNRNIVWNGNELYSSVQNIVYCEFTPVTFNDNNIVYQQRILNVNPKILIQQLKKSNADLRYVEYNQSINDYREIYIGENIQTGKKEWKILPRSVMENRDKIFLQEFKNKNNVFFMDIDTSDYQKYQEATNYSTPIENLERHRFSWKEAYDRALFESLQEIRAPNDEDINNWLESANRRTKRLFNRVKNFFRNETEEMQNKLALGLIEDNEEIPKSIENYRNNIVNSFYNFFIKDQGFLKNTGQVNLDNVNKRFSEMKLNEWKKTEEYQNLQLQNRNRENLFRRNLNKQVEILTETEQIFDLLKYESIISFSPKKMQSLNDFLNKYSLQNISESDLDRTISDIQNKIDENQNFINERDENIELLEEKIDELQQDNLDLSITLDREQEFENYRKLDSYKYQLDQLTTEKEAAQSFILQKKTQILHLKTDFQIQNIIDKEREFVNPSNIPKAYLDDFEDLKKIFENELDGNTEDRRKFLIKIKNKLIMNESKYDDYRYKNIKSYLEAEYSLNELSDAAEFERKYERYKKILKNIADGDDDIVYYDDNIIESEKSIENRFDQDLKSIVLENVNNDEKFYTVNREKIVVLEETNVEKKVYEMDEKLLKEIIDDNFDLFYKGNGKNIIEENREKYGNLIDNMKIQKNTKFSEISIFEEIEMDIDATIRVNFSPDFVNIVEIPFRQENIKNDIDRYKLYLGTTNKSIKSMNKLYRKLKQNPTDTNNIITRIEEIINDINSSTKFVDIVDGEQELMMRYFFRTTVKKYNSENKYRYDNTNSIRTFESNLNQLGFTRPELKKKYINCFLAVCDASAQFDNFDIDNLTLVFYSELIRNRRRLKINIDISDDDFSFKIRSLEIKSPDMEEVNRILKDDRNKNAFQDFKNNDLIEFNKLLLRREPNTKDLIKASIDERISSSTEDIRYVDILNQEQDDKNIADNVKNHRSNIVKTLESNDNFFNFSKSSYTKLYTKILTTPNGNITVHTAEDFVGTTTYDDWINSEETQERITTNHGYIDPPVVDHRGGWKEYYKTISPEWKKVLNNDHISLNRFEWTENSNGEISAQFTNKSPESYITTAKNLLVSNKINKLRRYMKKHRRFFDNVPIQAKLPIGQPIKINGVYFMKINANNVTKNFMGTGDEMDSFDSSVDKNSQFLVKITEEQLRMANDNSVELDFRNKISLRLKIKEKFGINLSNSIIDYIEDTEALKGNLNAFNIYQLNIIIKEIENKINKGESINTIFKDETTLKLEKFKSFTRFIRNNKNITTIDKSSFDIPPFLDNEINEYIEDIQNSNKISIKTKQKDFIKKIYEPYLAREVQDNKKKILSELSEINVDVTNNSSIVENFNKTDQFRNDERLLVIKSRGDLKQTMETVTRKYINDYYSDRNDIVTEYFKKDMWSQPNLYTKKDILDEWTKFITSNGGLNPNAPEPPVPHNYSLDSKAFTNLQARQLYRQANIAYNVGQNFLNTWYGKTLVGAATVGGVLLGVLGVVGIGDQFSEDLCETELYDTYTGQRKKADEKCDDLNIERMAKFCENMSFNKDGVKYVYDINVGDQYTRRHTTEGDELAQDPNFFCTNRNSDGTTNVSNTNLLKKTKVCPNLQYCSVVNVQTEVKKKDNRVLIDSGLDKYNIPIGKHKIEDILRLTGKTLDALVDEHSIDTIMSQFIFGMSIEEYKNLQIDNYENVF